MTFLNGVIPGITTSEYLLFLILELGKVELFKVRLLLFVSTLALSFFLIKFYILLKLFSSPKSSLIEKKIGANSTSQRGSIAVTQDIYSLLVIINS